MAIDVELANYRAYQLTANIDELQYTKTKLVRYRNTLQSNWKGVEVNYMAEAIDQTISQINGVIHRIDELAGDIRTAAANIRNEEIAAAERARRIERERRIEAAQNAYNDAKINYNTVIEKINALNRELDESPLKRFLPSYSERINNLNEELEKAIKRFDECKQALSNAKG